MTGTKIALTVSKYFDKVYRKIADVIDAIEIRSFNAVPPVDHLEKIVHLNGFINHEFDEFLTPSFLKNLTAYDIRSFSFDLGPSCERVKI